ncbi:MAG: alpha/beta fold hydrolase [Pseudomonadota bacterium]
MRVFRWVALTSLVLVSVIGLLSGCASILADRIVTPPNADGPKITPDARESLVERMGLQPGSIGTLSGTLAFLKMPAKPMQIALTAEFSTNASGVKSAEIEMTFDPDPARNAYSKPVGTIVSLHGFGLEKESMPGYASMFADAGFDVYMVDLPGHGESTGEYVTYGLRESQAIAGLINKLIDEQAPKPLIVFGVSLGGATAIRAAAIADGVDAVLAMQPFENPLDVIPNFRHRAPAYLRWAISEYTMEKAIEKAERKAGFAFEDARIQPLLGEYETPTLLMHSAQDLLVPAAQSESLARSIDPLSALLVDPDGMGHQSFPVDVGQRCHEMLPWLTDTLDIEMLGNPCEQIVTFDELRNRN